MSSVIKCCHCNKYFFNTGRINCPHCHFPIFKENKLLTFDLWDKIKEIFNKE